MKRFHPFLLSLVAIVVWTSACGTGGGVDVRTEALAPAGSNSAIVSNTIPANMAPGERLLVTVTMTNTGATPGVNDWTTARPTSYNLYRPSGSTSFGWLNTVVPAVTPVGSNATFSFAIVAPTTPGSYNFRAQMFAGGGGFFGPILSVPVTVTAGATPAYGCAYEPGMSSVPTTLPPGANQAVTIAVRNTGTQPWTPSTFQLYSRNSPTNLWNVNNTPLTTTVAPGAVGVFNFSIRAPATTAVQPFVYDMFQSGGIGFFGQDCVNLSIDVTGSPALNSSFVSSTFPAAMAPSEVRSVSITMQNTGSQSWTAGTTFAINVRHSPIGLWGTIIRYLDTTVPSGGNAVFTFPVTAPSTPGTYTAAYQVRKVSGSDAGFFGATYSTSVDVSASTTPGFACSYVAGSSTVPSTMIANTSRSVTVAVQNTGSETWTPSNFYLYSQNSPAGRWGTLNVALATTVAPTEVGTFTFTITAPAAAGATPFVWDMFQGGAGVGFFGQNCVNLSVGVIASEIDLASQISGRSVTGGTGTFVAPVTIGDVNDDTVPDVLIAKLTPPTGVARNQCGVVYGFVGGAGFFTDTSTAVPSDAAFAIVGAEAGDQLGIYQSGNIVVGDVTGDGVEDVIVGAPGGDGPSNARAAAGDVYVISGGLGLSGAGTIDLGATTPPASLAATIHGAAVGDALTPLAVADLTGDGNNDLVLGAPQNGAGGSSVGLIYIVVGTPTGLTGTLDLAAPGTTSVITVTGGAGDVLGRVAAVGDFMGDGTMDLLLGSAAHSQNATRDGAAWAFAGPITANRTVGSADATWYGRSATDGLGSAVGVGDVRGTNRGDVVIGVIQYLQPGISQSGAVAVFDGPIAPGVYDLSVSEASVAALILGENNGDNFGGTARVGDVNGDGRADIVAGARTADGPGEARDRSGEVAVILGGSTLTGTLDLSTTNPSYLIYGPIATALTASYNNALLVGDIDGDGRDDICVGTHGAGRVDCVRSPF